MEGGWGAGPYSRGTWGRAWLEAGTEDTLTLSDASLGGYPYFSDYAESLSVTDAYAAGVSMSVVIMETVVIFDQYKTWQTLGNLGSQVWAASSPTGGQVWSNIVPGTTPDWE